MGQVGRETARVADSLPLARAALFLCQRLIISFRLPFAPPMTDHRARFHKVLDQAQCQRLAQYLAGGRNHQEAHARRNLLAADHRRRRR